MVVILVVADPFSPGHSLANALFEKTVIENIRQIIIWYSSQMVEVALVVMVLGVIVLGTHTHTHTLCISQTIKQDTDTA